ncbi:unnamed protein product [Thelazia callipaeda]|uniref:C3H1-type domain-containing protein n=1 Tax=Thelazia callipaeda TaxID=103827 RepID=A0A0N5D116_THECL|nr:unnamed protein product [Thelazia callipaeda]
MPSINNLAGLSNGWFPRPTSLGLSSNNGDSGFLQSRYGSATGSINNGFTRSSSNHTSVCSSPAPREHCITQQLQNAAGRLTLRNGTVTRNDASLQLHDASFLSAISGFYDLTTRNLMTDNFTKQQGNNTRSRDTMSIARKLLKPESYKTVMCQAWLANGTCSFGTSCRFAHGEEELRPCKLPMKNPKYKTKLCDKYTIDGLCPYGNRCLFIHPHALNASNPYIYPDRYKQVEYERIILESMKKNRLKVKAGHIKSQPPPSWPLETPAFFSAHRYRFDHLAENINPVTNSSSITFGRRNVSSQASALNDITNQVMQSRIPQDVFFTRNRYSNGNRRGNQSNSASSSSGGNSGLTFSNHSAPTMDSLYATNCPFQFAIITDNLARSLACEFNVD